MRELIKTVRHIQVKMLVITHKVNVALRLSVCPVIHIVKLLVFKADLYEMRNYLQGLMDFYGLITSWQKTVLWLSGMGKM